MIKIKILNQTKGRNEPTFRPFQFIKNNLMEYSIEITNSDDYDFLFIGMADFHDMSMTLEDSVDWGLNNIERLSQGGDYFLFDGFDSTSMLGSYEVFEKSNAIYLFKNQLLNNKDCYKNVYAYGKWWFGTGSGLDVSYDIPDEIWSRIKLSGFNLGSQLPDFHNHYKISDSKTNDVCAIYQGNHPPAPFNQVVAPGIQYTNHRSGAWDVMKEISDKCLILKGRLPKDQYLSELRKSNLALSPFGQGEICYRDFELMQFGSLMIKPDMSLINTYPNPYIKNETYVSVKHDWSDLNETIENVLDNYKDYHYIIDRFREEFKIGYTVQNMCLHWYNIFSNLNEVSHEE